MSDQQRYSDKMQRIMKYAIRKVEYSLIRGSDTRSKDLIETDRLSEKAVREIRAKKIIHNLGLIEGNLTAKDIRAGNCHERANLLAMHLWKKNYEEIYRIEVVAGKDFDHVFCIINRAEGDINDPDSWGDDVFVVDPWADDYYQGGYKYVEKMIQHIKNAIEDAKKIEELFGSDAVWEVVPDVDNINTDLRVLYTIYPEKHSYPYTREKEWYRQNYRQYGEVDEFATNWIQDLLLYLFSSCLKWTPKPTMPFEEENRSQPGKLWKSPTSKLILNNLERIKRSKDPSSDDLCESGVDSRSIFKIWK